MVCPLCNQERFQTKIKQPSPYLAYAAAQPAEEIAAAVPGNPWSRIVIGLVNIPKRAYKCYTGDDSASKIWLTRSSLRSSLRGGQRTNGDCGTISGRSAEIDSFAKANPMGSI